MGSHFIGRILYTYPQPYTSAQHASAIILSSSDSQKSFSNLQSCNWSLQGAMLFIKAETIGFTEFVDSGIYGTENVTFHFSLLLKNTGTGREWHTFLIPYTNNIQYRESGYFEVFQTSISEKQTRARCNGCTWLSFFPWPLRWQTVDHYILQQSPRTARRIQNEHDLIAKMWVRCCCGEGELHRDERYKGNTAVSLSDRISWGVFTILDFRSSSFPEPWLSIDESANQRFMRIRQEHKKKFSSDLVQYSCLFPLSLTISTRFCLLIWQQRMNRKTWTPSPNKEHFKHRIRQ